VEPLTRMNHPPRLTPLILSPEVEPVGGPPGGVYHDESALTVAAKVRAKKSRMIMMMLGSKEERGVRVCYESGLGLLNIDLDRTRLSPIEAGRTRRGSRLLNKIFEVGLGRGERG